MKVVWFGIFDRQDGYGVASQDYVRALKRQGIDVTIIGSIDPLVAKDLRENIKPIPADDPYVLFIHTFPWSNVISGYLKELQTKAVATYYVTVWEASHTPWQWLNAFKQCDGVIVPSSFSKVAFRRSMDQYGLNIPIYVIPHIVEPSANRTTPLPDTIANIINQDDINILSLSTGTGHRKGTDILLKAFLSEFSSEENVALNIKTYDTDIHAKFSNIFDLFQDHAKVNSITGVLTHSEIRSLYQNCEIFTMLSRGEGFCIPLAEAKSEGCKIVAVHGKYADGQIGGPLYADDFLTPDDENIFAVRSKWDRLNGAQYATFASANMFIDTSRMYWVEPYVYHARIQLRKAVNAVINNPKRPQYDCSLLSMANIGVKLLNIITGATKR